LDESGNQPLLKDPLLRKRCPRSCDRSMFVLQRADARPGGSNCRKLYCRLLVEVLVGPGDGDGGTFGSDGEIADRRVRGVTVMAIPGSSTWLQEFPASVLLAG